MGNVISTITSSITNVINTILSIPQTIIDLLSELLQFLFVPEEDFFSDKITYFREKFVFVDSCVDCVDVIIDAFENPTDFGSLYIDLSSNRSSINLGTGKINVLNVSWYSEYKPTGDKIISSFMWLYFLFNVFKQLPGIINGASGAVLNYDNIQSELEVRKDR